MFMSKISRTYRLDPEVINSLTSLVELYNKVLPSYLRNKKVTATDVITNLIMQEVEKLKNEGYDI
jgi:hypothetical protein